MARSVLASIRGVPPDEIPARLCALCTELLPVTGASISLMAQAAARRLLCSSDEVARQLAEVQYTLGDGPGLHAFSIGAPVFAADLTKGEDARRWPVFALRALETGAEAVFAFPLGIGAIAAGTLDLYRDSPGTLSETETAAALLIADAATLGVLRLYAGRGETEYIEGNGDMDWLGGESDHDEVHQATGMVMIQCDVGAEEALLMLRARAFANGISLPALARDVVERRILFGGGDEG
ncbi:MAG TPA: ANTAR domain-containing protein [Actinocrinis sp.]|uniref:ANTAR domain-containing protein n=1 Tax=Actinocrinis sp. TaxID=1920516 RepID=UPI002D618670|nr:ANTAR domain-containing protein [Actinocrinis sp.]HZU57327.1 ANTAR domain-containing protein [Actinocrinis sp.]